MTIDLTTDEIDRFFSRIAVGRPDECWRMKAVRYAMVTVVRNGVRKSIGANRLAWELSHRARVPDGLQVLHKCDVPQCVNPAHLFIGTQQENIRDCASKGRHNSQQLENLKITNEQVAVILQRSRAGEQYTVIARDLGLSRTVVSYYARGLMGRTVHIDPAPKRIGHKWTASIDKQAVIRLRSEGLSFHGIAKCLGIAPMSAWRIVRAGEAR